MNATLFKISTVVSSCALIIACIPAPNALPVTTLKPDQPASILQKVQLRGEVFAVADAVGTTGTPIPLQIQLPQTIPVGLSFISISGVPTGFSLSVGFDAGDSWIVSLKDVNKLSLVSPSDFVGIVTLSISLVRGKEFAPEQRTVTLTIKPNTKDIAKAPQSTVSVISTPETLSDPTAPKPEKRISEQDEKILLERANDLVQNSDFVSARLIFEELARQGSGRGAFLMGQSFDPFYAPAGLRSKTAASIQQAQKWYEKAKQLGYTDAEVRLKALAER